MNGVDPSPQNVAVQTALLTQHRVKVLIYNPQAGDTITASLLQVAKRNHIPIVGAYETLPHGDTYATWMLAETTAIYKAPPTRAVNGDDAMTTLETNQPQAGRSSHPILELQHLSVNVGQTTLLHDLNAQVNNGDFVGLPVQMVRAKPPCSKCFSVSTQRRKGW